MARFKKLSREEAAAPARQDSTRPSGARFRKLSREEAAAPSPRVARRPAAARQEYVAFLRGVAVGEGGEALLVEDEKRQTVKNRLKAAAKTLDLTLSFKRAPADRLRFQVAATEEAGAA